jgi:hypothetical protein
MLIVIPYSAIVGGGQDECLFDFTICRCPCLALFDEDDTSSVRERCGESRRLKCLRERLLLQPPSRPATRGRLVRLHANIRCTAEANSLSLVPESC